MRRILNSLTAKHNIKHLEWLSIRNCLSENPSLIHWEMLSSIGRWIRMHTDDVRLNHGDIAFSLMASIRTILENTISPTIVVPTICNRL